MTNRYFYDPDKAARLAAIAATDTQIDTNEETFRTEDIGGGGGSTLLGPFTVSFDDDDFVNSSASNGIATLAIPSGSIVEAFAIGTEHWDGAVSGDQFVLGLAPDADGSDVMLVTYELSEMAPESLAVLAIGFREGRVRHIVDAVDASATNVRVLARQDCNIYAVVYTDETLTAGSADIYALIYTP